MLQEIDYLPPTLLQTASPGLAALLGRPTLVHLAGARSPALFLSLLLHGNETVGWEAVRGLLRDRLARFGELRLPRALSLLIGNVSAAAIGVRHLPGQPDYNRVWPGGEAPPSAERELMSAVVETMRRRRVFASIDLHNNTGTNPHYACVNRLDDGFLQLATLFSRVVVYFTRPTGVQSMAMAQLCPAVTLECGKVGDAAGEAHARAMIDACLHLSEIPSHPVSPRDIDLFHTIAQMRVPSDLTLSLAPDPADLMLDPGLERMNFQELPEGTTFARVRDGVGMGLEVRDDQGRDVTDRLFQMHRGELRLSRSLMPSMLTRDLEIVRQDCLGYLMERYNDRLARRDAAISGSTA